MAISSTFNRVKADFDRYCKKYNRNDFTYEEWKLFRLQEHHDDMDTYDFWEAENLRRYLDVLFRKDVFYEVEAEDVKMVIQQQQQQNATAA